MNLISQDTTTFSASTKEWIKAKGAISLALAKVEGEDENDHDGLQFSLSEIGSAEPLNSILRTVPLRKRNPPVTMAREDPEVSHT